ncbi:MAG TPA: DUF4331 domain-containing protein [Bryobacteraceae bacterium]|nr:DUF4331 domain-containing protein [Bryobacteraceae bacterium]
MKRLTPYVAALLSAMLAAPVPFFAASHREAPLTALDHPADITDFFAFVSYDDPSKVTFILDVDPLLEPANGPNYFPFDPDVLYSIKIDNTYDAVEDISFEFRFTTEVRAPGVFTGFVGAGGGIGGIIPPAITALDGAGSAGLSLRQHYTVTMVQGAGDSAVRTDLTGKQTLYAVPSNVGPRTMPNYPALAHQGIYSLGNGVRVFAGTVDDPFYIDLGATFDSLNFRPGAFLSGNPPILTPSEDLATTNSAADTLSGYNVNCIAIEVPITMVTTPGKPVIGSWGATYRAQMTVRGSGANQDSGGFVQVQRMGNPLINELIIGTGDKDKWSRSLPKDDAQFASYALTPLLATVFNTVFGIAVPPPPRVDLLPLVQYAPVFGDKSIPAGPVADLLRLNTNVQPTTDPAARNRLGLLGGDGAGFPNGRRVSDDVTDIAMRVVAGALVGGIYGSYRLGDGVNNNDVPYQETFPYVAWANSGRNRRHIDPGEFGCGPLTVTQSGTDARGPCPVN